MLSKDFRPKDPSSGRPLTQDAMSEMAGQRDDTRPEGTSGAREMHIFSKTRGSKNLRPTRVEPPVLDDEEFTVEGLEDLSEEDLDPKALSAAEPADSLTSEKLTQTGGSTQSQENPASAERVNSEPRVPVPGLPISSSPTTVGSPPPPAVVST